MADSSSGTKASSNLSLSERAQLYQEEKKAKPQQRHVLLITEDLTDEEQISLNKQLNVKTFNPLFDYKRHITQLFDCCDLLLIDLRDKQSNQYYASMRSYIEDHSNVIVAYKAEIGTKIKNKEEIRERYKAKYIIKHLPLEEEVGENCSKEDYVFRFLSDHISSQFNQSFFGKFFSCSSKKSKKKVA